MIGIDLFSGAGGMSLGAQNAGIDVVLAVESNRYAAATYQLNFPHVRMICADIASLREVEVGRDNEPTVLFGGPPCQGFSTSNQRTRNTLNPRNWLFREFLRIAALWQPDWIVFENVKGITETEKGLFLDCILEELRKLGYTPIAAVLNAVDFGVPQRRSRLFVVASRHGVEFIMPHQTVEHHLNVADAFCQLPELENGANEDMLCYTEDEASEYSRRMRGNLDKCSGHLVTRNAEYILERYVHIPQGGNWTDIPQHLMSNYADQSRCHTGIYHRLEW